MTSSSLPPPDHLLSDTGDDATTQLSRAGATYDVLAQFRDRLVLPDTRTYEQQYASLYFERLVSLQRPATERAKRRWSGTSGDPVHVARVLDITTGHLCFVTGTVYIDMPNKPNVLEDIALEHKVLAVKECAKYYSDEDIVQLEDSSGRIVLTGDYIKANRPVTGVITAVLGRQTASGSFDVVDMCHAGLPPMLDSTGTDDGTCLALVSGVSVGASDENALATQLLSQYLRGELGSLSDQHDEAKIARVLLAGNTFTTHVVKTDTWQSRRAARDVASSGADADTTDEPNTMHQADAFLEQLCEALDVDLMPGERDPTNVALPQQPIVRTVLPKSSRYKSLVCATNPCWYRVGARTILAQSGQALDDVMRYVEGKTRLEMAAAMLDWRHIAPSAPDTLWCYPFRSQDPFIIEACPDIYVIGNQPAFETTVVEGDDGQQVRVVLLPAFASTGTLARVDLASLACQSVQLDTAL